MNRCFTLILLGLSFTSAVLAYNPFISSQNRRQVWLGTQCLGYSAATVVSGLSILEGLGVVKDSYMNHGLNRSLLKWSIYLSVASYGTFKVAQHAQHSFDKILSDEDESTPQPLEL